MILVNLMMVTGSTFAGALMALIIDMVVWGFNRNVGPLCPCGNATAPDTGPSVALKTLIARSVISAVLATFLAILMVCQCCKNKQP